MPVMPPSSPRKMGTAKLRMTMASTSCAAITASAPSSPRTKNRRQRLVGAGQGLSYESTSRDMSETNYSSARQGMIEDDLTYTEEVELLQGKFMVEVYETFLISAVLAGKLTIPDFWNDPQKYMEHEWVASPNKWIDPQKEANANKTALESCVKSFKQISAEQGRDWKEQIDDMADVVAYAKEKGVQIGGYKSVQNEPQTDPKENPDE